MRLDDLDRILSAERSAAPGSSFTETVMARIHAEQLRDRRVAFPWVRFVLIAAAWVISVYLLLPADPIPQAMGFADYDIYLGITAPVDASMADTVLWAGVSLIATVASVWLSLRLAGSAR